MNGDAMNAATAWPAVNLGSGKRSAVSTLNQHKCPLERGPNFVQYTQALHARLLNSPLDVIRLSIAETCA